MRNDVDHLPITQPDELARVVAILMEEFEKATSRASQDWRRNGKIYKIILFGSYSRDEWVDEPKNGAARRWVSARQGTAWREPDDWKPFPAVGPGTREIRIAEDGNVFRVIYVAKFGDKIHVLHCFQKKTQATPKKDIDLAKKWTANLNREFGK